MLGLWSVLVSTETAGICPESLMGKAWVTSFRLIAEVDGTFCTFDMNYKNLVISTICVGQFFSQIETPGLIDGTLSPI